jgi:hypothetical protein
MIEKQWKTDVKAAINDKKNAEIAADSTEEPINDPQTEAFTPLTADSTAADVKQAINALGARQGVIIATMGQNNAKIRTLFKVYRHWHLSTAEILLDQIDKLRERITRKRG